MTGRTEGINQIANRSYIEINAVDAQALGIQVQVEFILDVAKSKPVGCRKSSISRSL